MLRKLLATIAGTGLLLHGGAALAFTIITLPPASEEQGSSSNSVTESTVLSREVQPITGAIQAQLIGLLRQKQRSRRISQAGILVASNAHAGTRRDVDFLLAASSEPAIGGGGSGGSDSLWVSSSYNAVENEFVRTQFIGDTRYLVAGFDLTRSDRYVVGIALTHEATDFSTVFNAGYEKTRGYNVAPYFAYLLSDSWSVDLSLGHGEFETQQSRSLATNAGIFPVNSTFESTRDFASANLTHVSALGNWTLTGSVGAMGAERKKDGYVEGDGTVVASGSTIFRQWNLTGEAAYGGGDSEVFLGLAYERLRDPPAIRFASGEQPANDPDSAVVSAGWRHFGKRVTANFAISSRVAQDQVREYGVGMTLRIDL